MIRSITFFLLIVSIISCNPKPENEAFKHTYVKYWEKYSEQQLIDSLFADTLRVGQDVDEGWNSRKFYVSTTKQLISDLQDDHKQIDSLYPMTAFDKLTIKKLPYGLRHTFTKEQTTKFLEIINNPVSFNWAETTYEPRFQIDFYKDNLIVAILTIDEGLAVIKSNPNWPIFKKFKFGILKSEPSARMKKLLKEVLD